MNQINIAYYDNKNGVLNMKMHEIDNQLVVTKEVLQKWTLNIV